ncbi:MAG: ACP S-malonyltransferase [Oscillospiraceae bacterium]|nr:ACP S-malonyltransferase [Oscillospiraceae bacterium]
MGKVAFVFPGQGAQYSGMGRELAELSPAAADVFRMADAIRPGTSEQCFAGSEEQLRETKITQPCMFTVELAAAAALEEAEIRADMTAGFSLGELAALTYAKVVDESTTFSLVCRRGELMQEAAQMVSTSMAAVVRLDNETIEGICAQFEGVYPVNYNCPGQVTVAGLSEKMADFSAAVKAAGGRAIPLKVSGGFHSPFMAEASARFGALLEAVELHESAITLYSNCTGLPYEGNVKELLAKQICSPVRWEAIVRHMIASGVDTFIEVGPGNVLSGLIGKIDKNVRTFQVCDKESFEKCVAEVKVC